MQQMRRVLLCAVFSLLGILSCKSPPPDITPCLVDIKADVAHCSPVNQSKKPFDLPIPQMDKYYALSNADMGTLLQWINAHDQ